MKEGFDGIFQKEIVFSNGLNIIVVYNPYLDRWEFHFMDKRFVFNEVCGKMVYRLLSSMKWVDESNEKEVIKDD